MFRLSGAPVGCSTSALVATRLSTGALVLVSRFFTIKDTSVPLGLQKMGDVVMGVFSMLPSSSCMNPRDPLALLCFDCIVRAPVSVSQNEQDRPTRKIGHARMHAVSAMQLSGALLLCLVN